MSRRQNKDIRTRTRSRLKRWNNRIFAREHPLAILFLSLTSCLSISFSLLQKLLVPYYSFFVFVSPRQILRKETTKKKKRRKRTTAKNELQLTSSAPPENRADGNNVDVSAQTRNGNRSTTESLHLREEATKTTDSVYSLLADSSCAKCASVAFSRGEEAALRRGRDACGR